jgi:hypothetical protein
LSICFPKQDIGCRLGRVCCHSSPRADFLLSAGEADDALLDGWAAIGLLFSALHEPF